MTARSDWFMPVGCWLFAHEEQGAFALSMQVLEELGLRVEVV